MAACPGRVQGAERGNISAVKLVFLGGLYNSTHMCLCDYYVCAENLRGVKDWVHMKTAKLTQDFNCFCNLDVNHKLWLIFMFTFVHYTTR